MKKISFEEFKDIMAEYPLTYLHEHMETYYNVIYLNEPYYCNIRIEFFNASGISLVESILQKEKENALQEALDL